MGQCLFPHRVRRREPEVSTGERGEWIQANICGKPSLEGEERRVIPLSPPEMSVVSFIMLMLFSGLGGAFYRNLIVLLYLREGFFMLK